jgi:hypothetical protein
MVICTSSIFVTGGLAIYLPGSTNAYHLILLSNHLAFCFGIIGQSLAAKEVTFSSSDLIPYLYSSVSSSFAVSMLFGLLLSYLEVSMTHFYLWHMVPITILFVITLALHSHISNSVEYKKGLRLMSKQPKNFSISELWRSLCKVCFEFFMLVFVFALIPMIFPSLIQRLNPSSVSRLAWNDGIQFIGYAAIFIGSMASSKWIKMKRWQLVIASAVILAYTVFICNQFLADSLESNDRLWWVVAGGCLVVSFLLGAMLNILSDMILSVEDDRYAAYLATPAINLGYMIGGTGTFIIGQFRPE